MIDPAQEDEDTQALRALNERIAADRRVRLAMLPIGDGLSLVRKLGFGHTGSQWDEEDGLELVFELDGLATAQPMRPYTPHDTN